MTPLLAITGLSVAFGPPARPLRAVSDVDLTLNAGEIIGIAGESGSGKTTLCAAVIRALPRAARVGGEVLFEGRSIPAMSARELRRLRGGAISMILQNPMTSLDPLFTIGNQFGEALAAHGGAASRERALDLLGEVHLTAPEMRLRQYPHEQSGGILQRILIAMAIAGAPRLLIADEPTTALDATIQEEILLLFQEIRERHGTAIAVVTHDLGVIERLCDRIVVMYAGRIVEEGPVADVFARPRHPYTEALLGAMPRLSEDRTELHAIPGQVPSLAEIGPGCAFAERCARSEPRCGAQRPPETWLGADHRVACWRAEEP